MDTRQELTPVAIKAGVRLARRLYSGSTEKMDYSLVPTTVFTPQEYGCIGMSEEQAIEMYGEENVEVYHSYFKPLEWTINHEALDGVAHVAMRMGAKKRDFDGTVGIHPTVSEEFTTLSITKRSGVDAAKKGC